MNFSCFLPYKRPFAVIVNVIVVEWDGSEIVYGILRGPDGDFFCCNELCEVSEYWEVIGGNEYNALSVSDNTR